MIAAYGETADRRIRGGVAFGDGPYVALIKGGGHFGDSASLELGANTGFAVTSAGDA